MASLLTNVHDNDPGLRCFLVSPTTPHSQCVCSEWLSNGAVAVSALCKVSLLQLACDTRVFLVDVPALDASVRATPPLHPLPRLLA